MLKHNKIVVGLTITQIQSNSNVYLFTVSLTKMNEKRGTQYLSNNKYPHDWVVCRSALWFLGPPLDIAAITSVCFLYGSYKSVFHIIMEEFWLSLLYNITLDAVLFKQFGNCYIKLSRLICGNSCLSKTIACVFPFWHYDMLLVWGCFCLIIICTVIKRFL